MAIKNKIKYKVAYNSSTDTLSDKLNILLNNIVTLITTNNPQLSVLTRIEYGSEQMTGAPLFNGSTKLGNGKVFNSDVVFIGTNKNNIVFSMCFYDDNLVISMNLDPVSEEAYVTKLKTLYGNNIKAYALGRIARYYNSSSNQYSVNLPYIIVNGEIEIGLSYWHGSNSSGYMFYNVEGKTNGVDLVIYKTYEDANNTEGVGGALWRYTTLHNYGMPNSQLLAWSFNEDIANNLSESFSYHTDTYNNANKNVLTVSSDSQASNGKYDFREWLIVNRFDITTAGGASDPNNSVVTHMQSFHTLGALNGGDPKTYYMPTYANIESRDPSSGNFISPVLNAYNLPLLSNDGDVCLNQVKIPGFNKYCVGELYLMYTPSRESYKSGDIIEVDGDNYAIINNGIVCWSVKI